MCLVNKVDSSFSHSDLSLADIWYSCVEAWKIRNGSYGRLAPSIAIATCCRYLHWWSTAADCWYCFQKATLSKVVHCIPRINITPSGKVWIVYLRCPLTWKDNVGLLNVSWNVASKPRDQDQGSQDGQTTAIVEDTIPVAAHRQAYKWNQLCRRDRLDSCYYNEDA